MAGNVFSYRRSAAALSLVLTAVAVPTAAWYAVGTRQIEDRLGLDRKQILLKAQKKGLVEAERLGARLEMLRESESRRPFYHYKNLFHDPMAAAEGAFVTQSPLATGPDDPLIAAYFQVDNDGVLTLPTINEEFPELQATDSAHCAVLEELRDVTYFCLEEMVFGDYAEPAVVAAADSGLDAAPPNPLAAPQPALFGAADASEIRRTTLSRRAWHQHLESNAVYADIKYSERAASEKAAPSSTLPRDDDDVQVAVWPFTWHTLPVGEENGLVALRKVETPVGVWSQGFVVSLDEVRAQLASSYYPTFFEPLRDLEMRRETEGLGRGDFLIHEVPRTSWAVGVDISSHSGEAEAEAAAERKRFVRTFLVGTLGAALAGLLVVVMVYQSERLAAQRAQFAASAAHELRTPLAGLRLYGEMLAEGLGNPEGTRSYARRMAAEAERLGRVVTNVLSFTRLEREDLAVNAQPGDLAEAVENAFLRQKTALEEAGAALDVDLPSGLPEVRFDRDAVGHVVQNLLDNAEKYTRGIPGRTVTLKVRAAEEDSSAVELQVADNGRGVPPEERRRLFQPFARGRHEDAEGLGLGLVLVKALVDAQGASIRYRDREGGGAEFTVTFRA